jgi:hypothetical protein
MGRPSSGADHLVAADFRIHIRLDQREGELQVAGMSAVVQEVADQAGEVAEHIPEVGTAVDLAFDVMGARSSVKTAFGLPEGRSVDLDTCQGYNLPAVGVFASGPKSRGLALTVAAAGSKNHFGEQRIELVLAVVAARLQLGIGQ